MRSPKWMNWLFLAFIGYMLFAGNFNAPPKEAAAPQASTHAPTAYPHLNTLTRASAWQKALNPDQVAGCGAPEIEGLQVVLLRSGSGAATDCTSTLRLQVQRFVKAGFMPPKTTRTTLKDSTLPAAIRHGAFGMKQGEARLLIAAEEIWMVTR